MWREILTETWTKIMILLMGKENSKAPIVDFSEKPHLYVKLSENIFLFQMFPFLLIRHSPYFVMRITFCSIYYHQWVSHSKDFVNYFLFVWRWISLYAPQIASYHLWFRLCPSLLIPSNSFPNDLITSSSKKSITGSRFSSSLRRESFQNTPWTL